jgi:hypothetical protein
MAVDAWKLALLHSLALLPGADNATRAEALRLLRGGDAEQALRLLLEGNAPASNPAPARKILELLVLLLVALLLAMLFPRCCAEQRQAAQQARRGEENHTGKGRMWPAG